MLKLEGVSECGSRSRLAKIYDLMAAAEMAGGMLVVREENYK